MRLSKHADVRGRERGVEILSLLLIKCFGHPVKGADGSEVWIANKRERKEILKQCKAAQRNFERPDPPYFVEASDSTVITVGRRTRKIHRYWRGPVSRILPIVDCAEVPTERASILSRSRFVGNG